MIGRYLRWRWARIKWWAAMPSMPMQFTGTDHTAWHYDIETYYLMHQRWAAREPLWRDYK